MKDKFRENFKIALPAAIVSLVIILALSFGADLGGSVVHEYDLIQLIPYLIVLVGGIIGVNVFVVLLLGILSALSSWWPRAPLRHRPAGQHGLGCRRHVRDHDGGASGVGHLRAHPRVRRVRGAVERQSKDLVQKQGKAVSWAWGLLVGAMDIATRTTPCHRHLEPHRRRYGEDVRHLEAQDGVAARHVLVCVPGHPALRRADARGHLGRHGAGFRGCRRSRSSRFCSTRSCC